MKISHLLLLFLCSIQLACAQEAPAVRPAIENTAFDERLTELLSFTVPLMGVEELHQHKEELLLLDTRKKEEYDVSHIPGARYLGYRDFSVDKLKDIPKDTPIVLYCSVGYRSEKIGEKLHRQGYTQVFNLYGSLFEWANHGYPMEDKNGVLTQQVHTYNRTWSKWVEEGELDKVW